MDKIRLDSFRNECYEAISLAKKRYLSTIGNDLADPLISKRTYWKIINRVMNKCKAPRIPPILSENDFVINGREKATLFANYFSLQCKPLINDSVLPDITYRTESRLVDITVTSEEILSLIRNLNKGKSCGPDNISAHMLLLCDETIVLPLKIIYQQILSTGIFPHIWKSANLTPIHKKGSKQLVSNYRPISLLPICGKIFEKIIFNQLYSFLNSNNLITKNQSGFRSGDSTSNQLLELVNEIHTAFDNSKSLEVRSVFLDISKAFDKVWHQGLIFKLKQNGIHGNLLALFDNYLSGRKQRVVLNGSSSNFFPVESGVPQGSVLGPLLFLIYINELEDGIKSNVNFFADDTMIYSIVNDPLLTANELNHDLNRISKWAHQWKMSFNPDPSKQAVEMLFSQKKNKPYHPPLFFNNSMATRVSEHKHLGFIFDSKLKFSNHINEKISKARKLLGTLRLLSAYLPLNTLDQIYKLYIRPHFDYCDIIYHIPPSSNNTDLFSTLHPLMEAIERNSVSSSIDINWYLERF